ncbi:hypothetical protein K432DRAFT_306885, partial [Lepidopterella palustris CBS 459.81]
QSVQKEIQLSLAIQAIELDQILSYQRATATYRVPFSTLCDRIHGKPLQRDSTPKRRKLTDLEESIIMQYIFKHKYA